MDPSLYLDRDTWVHRLDPRTKMFLLLGMFALPFVFLNPLYELAVLALVLLFGYLAESLVNLRRIWFILLTIHRDHHPVVHRREWADAALPLRRAGGSILRVQQRVAHSHNRDRRYVLPLHHAQ